jgi:tripartite-type tricarboxylate transporter receptor subunit TctC
MISQRRFGIATAALCLALTAHGPVDAQSFPNKLIKLVVPAGPGGPTDVLARITAHHAQPVLGQNVIAENNAGAGGLIAARAVAKATPDGHTLLFANTSLLAVIPVISKTAGYDPAKDLVAVAKVAEAFQVLVVDSSFPANSVSELVAYAKANPGKLNYSSGGYGTLPHLAGEYLKSLAKIDAVHVLMKSDGEVVTAILGKQIQMSFMNVAVALPHVQGGKLKALAVTSQARGAELPNVPTMSESGITGYVVTSFFGVVAPAGTPPGTVDKLNMAINQGLKSREMDASLAKLGARPSPGSAQEFAAFIAAERQKWTTVTTAAGIRID